MFSVIQGHLTMDLNYFFRLILFIYQHDQLKPNLDFLGYNNLDDIGSIMS